MKRIWVIALVAACTKSEGPSSGPDAAVAVCGDGTCNVGETKEACPEDCALCGDGVCSSTETPTSCKQDCHACGDGTCDPDETVASCAADCSTCGDGMCTGTEDLTSCAADCSVCGDAMCTGAETGTTCAQDCVGSLSVANQSTFTISGLFVYPCGTTIQGSNQLAGNIISPNQTFTMTNVPAGCWNMHANATNGAFWDRFNTIVEAGHTFTWTLVN